MRKDVPPQKISELRAFPSALTTGTSASPERDIYQISKDGSYVWTTKGCVLEVFSAPQLCRISHWGFPALAKNPEVYISAVTEIPSWGGFAGARTSSTPYLLVALHGVNLLCLFDICCSKVIKCVQLPLQILCLEVIASQGCACLQTLSLFPDLRLMFGILALGTTDGQILLLDLCLDELQQTANETAPAQMLIVDPRLDSISATREQALEHNEHLCIALSGQNKRHGSFIYKGPGNKSLAVINTDDACVTSMMYIPHATLLVVGYKFGSFQLWNLQKLSIEYASPLSDSFNPVVRFAFQEPENDPRNYCYLWVVCGQDSQVIENESSSTSAFLYSLSYERKDWQDGLGFQYQSFNHCILRFEHLLSVDPFNQSDIEDTGGSRLVAFRMIQDNQLTTNRPIDMEEPQSDEWSNQDLSLCLIVWEAWEPPEMPTFFMAVFDINQWYQAQMPSSIKRPGMCSYFGVFSLMEVVDKQSHLSHDFIIQDMHVSLSSLLRFRTTHPVDETYHPSSFGFNATCLTDCGLLEICYLGTQRQLLLDLQKCGLECLRDPSELFLHCRHAGLLPHSDSVSVNNKREALLSMALENNLLAYLKECILEAPTVGHHSAGFSLRFITDWAWKRTSQIKAHVDKLCVPLFNCSGQELDQSSLSLLYNYASQLEALASLYRIIQYQATQATTQTGLEELSVREEVVQLVSVYLRIILWLHQNCCLLPEHAEGDAYGENEVAYPASTLTSAYAQRRQYLHRLHSSVGPTDLLLIDGLMSKLGDVFPLHWERGSSNSENGQRLYPPPSLFVFLNVYLVRDVALTDKHRLTLYLLLDLADYVSHKQSHLGERLMQFPAAFRLSPSLVKIIQGFWMLDRKDFVKATAFLTDPVVQSCDLEPWQHSRVLKSLLYQGQERLALIYMQIRKPPLDSPDDIKLHLSLLLSNRLISEAFNFQKQRADEDLLNHFFLGCQQTGNMCALLELPLNSNEEQALIRFLSDSSHPKSKEMLVVYFLQRHRPLQALEYSSRLSHGTSDELKSVCSNLVNQFISILPPAQVRLIKELSKPFSKTAFATGRRSYSEVVPVPLSSMVTKAAASDPHSSQATQFQTIMEALSSTWNRKTLDPQTPLHSRVRSNDVWTLDSMPFVGTPAAPTTQRRSESELVYATPVGKRSSSSVPDIMESPKYSNKRTRGMDIISPVRRMNSERRENRAFSTEVMMLLQTPPVNRRPPDLRAQTSNVRTQRAAPTPPSILKVSLGTSRQSTTSRVPILYPNTHPTGKDSEDVSETDMELCDNDSNDVSEDLTESPKASHFQIQRPLSSNSERSLTPEVKSAVVFSKPSTPVARIERRFSKTPTLNIAYSSPSFHESDDLIVEDDDITFNMSMPIRRDRLMARGSSYTRPSLIMEKVAKEQELPSLRLSEDSSLEDIGMEPANDQQQPSSSSCDEKHQMDVQKDVEPTINISDTNVNFMESDYVKESSFQSCSEMSNDAETSNAHVDTSALGIAPALKVDDSSFKSVSSPSVMYLENVQSSSTPRANENNQHSEINVSLSNDFIAPLHVISSPLEDKKSFILPPTPEKTYVEVPESKVDTSVPDSDFQVNTTLKAPSVVSHLELSSDSEMGGNVHSSDFLICSKISGNVLETFPLPDQNVVDLCESAQEEDVCKVGRWVNEQDTSQFVVEHQGFIPRDSSNVETNDIQVCSEEVELGTKLIDETAAFHVPVKMSESLESEPKESESFLRLKEFSSATIPENSGALEKSAVKPIVQRTFPEVHTAVIKREIFDAVAVPKLEQSLELENVTPLRHLQPSKGRSNRRKTIDFINPSQCLPPVPEYSPPPSSELSPSSSVFTTPEKKPSTPSQWNSRLRPRSESRTSSDSSPQSAKDSGRKKAPVHRSSSSPILPFVGHRKVTRSAKKEVRDMEECIPTAVMLTPTIPEESEDLLREEFLTPKPALPFVFSPPSTRSRTRRKKSDAPDASAQPSEPQGIGLLTSAGRPTTRSRDSSAPSSAGSTSAQWPVDFVKQISPFVGKEPKLRRSSIASRSSTSTRHSMTLRTGGTSKPRKVVKLK